MSTYPTEEWEKYLDDLLEKESGLRANEIDFLQDLDSHWRGRDLTERQYEWLVRIWVRVI